MSDDETGSVIGAAFDVHNTLGHGFLERVYLEALCVELSLRGIPFRREVAVPVYYKEGKLPCGYRVDLCCYRTVLVELKAQSCLTAIDAAQVLNYLKATDLERALLINFGTPRLQLKRFILSRGGRSPAP